MGGFFDIEETIYKLRLWFFYLLITKSKHIRKNPTPLTVVNLPSSPLLWPAKAMIVGRPQKLGFPGVF